MTLCRGLPPKKRRNRAKGGSKKKKEKLAYVHSKENNVPLGPRTGAGRGKTTLFGTGPYRKKGESIERERKQAKPSRSGLSKSKISLQKGKKVPGTHLRSLLVHGRRGKRGSSFKKKQRWEKTGKKLDLTPVRQKAPLSI